MDVFVGNVPEMVSNSVLLVRSTFMTYIGKISQRNQSPNEPGGPNQTQSTQVRETTPALGFLARLVDCVGISYRCMRGFLMYVNNGWSSLCLFSTPSAIALGRQHPRHPKYMGWSVSH
jgi:hypothetical protein